jgi:hypothetical protein
MNTYHVDGADLPVAYDVDVLVVGGGPAGVGAGFAAAREGKRVLIVEQFNCLGGVATAGGHGHYSIFCEWAGPRRIVGGIPYEIANRIVDEGFGTLDAHGTMFEVEGLKFILDTMALECRAGLLYHTFFCGSIVQDGVVKGGIIQGKSGRRAVLAKRVVDCTGDGDAAASAGAQFEQGRPSDGQCQPATLMFAIGGVDWPRVQAWQTDYQMQHVWEQAQKNGDMEPFQNQIMGFWWTPTRPDQVSVNFTHITDVDSTREERLSYATIEGRRQAYQCISVFRKYVPGMENCYMVSTAGTVGVRESRRIIGDVVLTEDDMKARRTWQDSIGYGSFFIDIHNIDGPGMDATTCRPERGFRYQIPYRILLPKGLDNILTAGRCVSVTHAGLGSLRVMVQCFLTGQAAGTAACISIDDNVPPREIDIARLQAKLRAGGCILNEEDIAANTAH